MLECAQPPPITTHNIIHTHSSRATTNNPRCQVQQALQEQHYTATTTRASRATWDSYRVSVLAQRLRSWWGEFSIKAVSCVLRSFYLAKLFGLSQIPGSGPASIPIACCRSRFVSGICHSVSQSVGRSFSYASQNCLQLGIPYSYTYSHSYSLYSYSYLCF